MTERETNWSAPDNIFVFSNSSFPTTTAQQRRQQQQGMTPHHQELVHVTQLDLMKGNREKKRSPSNYRAINLASISSKLQGNFKGHENILLPN